MMTEKLRAEIEHIKMEDFLLITPREINNTYFA